MRKPINPASEICLTGLESYLQVFYSDRLLEVTQMKDAITKGDYSSIAEIAHKWKGIAAPYGFGVLGEIACELEVAAQEKNHVASLQLITEAEDYLIIDKKKATHS